MIRRTAFAAFTAFAVLGATDISAQTIGFKLGASFANWSAEEDDQELDTDQFSSFMGGGFVRFGLGRLGLQPELLVVTRGAEFSDEEEQGITGRFKVDYIEVPVLLTLPLTTGTGIAPYIFGGPNFAFEIGCKVEAELGDIEASDDCDDLDPGETFDRKSTDIGATAGAGLEFPLGPGALLIEGRYNWGLSNISDIEGVDIKSRTAAVLAGYSIPLGPRY
jgi:hypothetical protein